MQGNLEKNCYQEAARVYGVDKIGCFSPFLCIVFLMHRQNNVYWGSYVVSHIYQNIIG